jgi:hypothetical protein
MPPSQLLSTDNRQRFQACAAMRAHSHDVVPPAIGLNVRGEGGVEAWERGVHEDSAAGGGVSQEHAVVLGGVVHRQNARVPAAGDTGWKVDIDFTLCT